MPENTQETIARIVRRIVERFEPEKIILYGSHARGEAGRRSDVDLLVLFSHVANARQRVSELYEAVSGSGLPKDIVVSTVSQFERYKDVPNTIYSPAAEEGKSSMSVTPRVRPEVEEIIRRWVCKADRDIEAVRRLLESGNGCPYDVACYHCEQAAERYLKALLTFYGIQAPRTHDIGHLHELLPLRCQLPIPNADLEYMSAYGIDSWWDPDRAQTLRALEIVRSLRGQIRERLPKDLLD
jgi:HEPN domain-containing protein/predicted nucleotidyltransferase